MKQKIIEKINSRKIIAIFRNIDADKCSQAANALYDGGIELCEVTFNQKEKADEYKSTLDGIRAMIAGKGNRDLYVGAGTVLNVEQVKLAYQAGATFIITPTCIPEVIKAANELGMVTMPGAYTATEIQTAYDAGADFVKIFPASDAGTKYIKAIRGPLSHIPMTAVGGINMENGKEFLKAGVAGLGIGGNLLNKEYISNGEFDKLTELAKNYVESIA